MVKLINMENIKMKTNKTYSICNEGFFTKRLDITTEQLYDVCDSANSTWIEDIQIMESFDKIEELDLDTKVKIVEKWRKHKESEVQLSREITLGDILKAIEKIASGKTNVNKHLESRIFNSYDFRYFGLDSEARDCILEIASFGEIVYS
jgi:hypothetical protein